MRRASQNGLRPLPYNDSRVTRQKRQSIVRQARAGDVVLP
jgi:hypothetical protein